jgi:hypothetical protein
MGSLSEWLKIMLDEIARKQDDATRAAAEQQQRELTESVPGNPVRKSK